MCHVSSFTPPRHTREGPAKSVALAAKTLVRPFPAPSPARMMRPMEDIVFIGIALAFFAVCVAYVRGLDRIVRGAEEAEAAQEVAA